MKQRWFANPQLGEMKLKWVLIGGDPAATEGRTIDEIQTMIDERESGVTTMSSSKVEKMAFPDEANYGMTLRQWYAGMAMQGMLASEVEEEDGSGTCSAAYLHTRAFLIADAMMKAGGK